MELKLALAKKLHVDPATFNRTSMELKLWIIGIASIRHCETFNRTSMELKHVKIAVATLVKITFNRTSMELKRGNPQSDTLKPSYYTFNRTSMELKRRTRLILTIGFAAAIGTFNRTSMELKRAPVRNIARFWYGF